MQLKLWMRAVRAPFSQAVIVPTVLGTAIAWRQTGMFHLEYFLLALLGVVFVLAGTNLANDYFDHKSRADDINKESTPFSGGSRVIQEGRIPPERLHRASLGFFFLAGAVGLCLVCVRGWPILAIGTAGILSGYFYTAPPMRLGYRGWGELLAGLNCGPLVVSGAYYVQTQSLSVEALAASVPVGLLITAILCINQLPDYRSDRAAGKETLIVKMGRERAVKGYHLLLILAYLLIAVEIALGAIPWAGLASLLTLPLAWKSIRAASANYANPKGLVPAMFNTIVIHLTVGFLLSLGYVVAGVLP